MAVKESRLPLYCSFRKSISSTISHQSSFFRSSTITQDYLIMKSKKSSKKSKSCKPKASKLWNNYDDVNNSVAEFPRKPYAFLIFMEKYLKQNISMNKPSKDKRFSVVFKMCGDKWKSMSEAEKAHYDDEADKRNVLYEKNMVIYNSWKSMSNTEKAPFIAKAKAPYLANIAQQKKKSREDRVITDLDEHEESDITDWDENEDFDFFAYIHFCEASKKPSESKKPVGKVRGPKFLFCQGFIDKYKKENPNDTRLHDVDLNDPNWWLSVPDEIKDSLKLWDEMTDAEKAPYVTRAEKIRDENLAYMIFRNQFLESYKMQYPNNQSVHANPKGLYEKCPKYLEDNVANLWKTVNKAPYFEIAKAAVQEFERRA